MKIFITGMPGCGKTTLMLELVKELKANNKKIAGIVTTELRNKKREGFLIKDLVTGKQEVLASTKQIEGQKERPKVSKYYVNIKAIDSIVKEAEKSFDSADVILIDEIGKMEFFSKAFRAMLNKVFSLDKKIIATLHRAYVKEYKNKGVLIWLEKGNLQDVKARIISLIK